MLQLGKGRREAVSIYWDAWVETGSLGPHPTRPKKYHWKEGSRIGHRVSHALCGVHVNNFAEASHWEKHGYQECEKCKRLKGGKP